MTPTLNQIDPKDLKTALKNFLSHLPDPNVYPYSSLIEYFFIDGKEVQLYASKNVGVEGKVWEIGILD